MSSLMCSTGSNRSRNAAALRLVCAAALVVMINLLGRVLPERRASLPLTAHAFVIPPSCEQQHHVSSLHYGPASSSSPLLSSGASGLTLLSPRTIRYSCSCRRITGSHHSLTRRRRPFSSSTSTTRRSASNDAASVELACNDSSSDMMSSSSASTSSSSHDEQHQPDVPEEAAEEAAVSLTVADSSVAVGTTPHEHRKRRRLVEALPDFVKFQEKDSDDDGLDALILKTAIPSMMNNAVVPIVNSVDTFWVGRMGVALALAGQSAANQAFFTLYFLVNYLPTITAPLVASAVGSGDMEQAKQRVCESLFIGNVLGLLVTILLVGFPNAGLSMVLPPGAPALDYAAPYLRFRALSMVPTILAATGFAAYRGLLDTVTPLKVSLGTNLLNLVLDPLLIFGLPGGGGMLRMGFVGAALATALSETAAGITYLRLLLKKKLTSIRLLFTPPKLKSLIPLLQGGLTMLGRQAALNFAFVSAARRAQQMDPSGVSAAAYGIVMQIYSVGIVVHVAMQGTAAALIPSTLANRGKDEARRVGDRMFVWGSLVGLGLGVAQLVALPWLVPLFSTLPAVQQAVKQPALLATVLHVINGPVLVGEGALLGLQCYRDLMLITAFSAGLLFAGLGSPFGQSLEGILVLQMVFSLVQAIGVVGHYFRVGPLAVLRRRRKEEKNKAKDNIPVAPVSND